MKTARFTEERRVKVLRETDRAPVTELASKHGVSDQPIYGLRRRYVTLRAAVLALACALTTACGDGTIHRNSRSGIEFGVWVAETGGDPLGADELSVELEDGRQASFRFRMVEVPGGLGNLSGGDVI